MTNDMQELDPNQKEFIDDLQSVLFKHLETQPEEVCRRFGVSMMIETIRLFFINKKGSRLDEDFEKHFNLLFVHILMTIMRPEKPLEMKLGVREER